MVEALLCSVKFTFEECNCITHRTTPQQHPHVLLGLGQSRSKLPSEQLLHEAMMRYDPQRAGVDLIRCSSMVQDSK
jgi:hypothetical protein